MAQYKAAMVRIYLGRNMDKAAAPGSTHDDDDIRDDGDLEDEKRGRNSSTVETLPEPLSSVKDAGADPEMRRRLRYVEDVDKHPALAALERHAAFLLMPVLPLLWIVLLVSTLDRPSLLETGAWATPLLTILSATLANAVPVGGGVVFVPILSLLGIEMHLGGAAFAVSTMTIGNGVCGFLNWLRKDPNRIAWREVPYAVVPAWIGAAIGTLRPFLTPEITRRCFALFALGTAMVLGRALARGGGDVAKAFDSGDHAEGVAPSVSDTLDEREDLLGVTESQEDAAQRIDSVRFKLTPTMRKKIITSVSSFLAGLILVSNIGVGNALTTFLTGIYVWRLPPKSAVVTGILCGGWTSFVPFLLHLIVLKDVPIPLWVMGLPGVYAGAKIAPSIHDTIGLEIVIRGFLIFLVVAGVVMLYTG